MYIYFKRYHRQANGPPYGKRYVFENKKRFSTKMRPITNIWEKEEQSSINQENEVSFTIGNYILTQFPVL